MLFLYFFWQIVKKNIITITTIKINPLYFMKKNISLNNLKAFTLIELLIVITIIWILATGAVTVYTTQIQKARDATRIGDIKSVQWAVEQVYQDNSLYPWADEFVTKTSVYIESLPADLKHLKVCNGWIACWYAYHAGNDSAGNDLWAYELVTAFENSWNVDSKAKKDNGDDDKRLETWAGIKTLATTFGTGSTAWSWACNIVGGEASNAEEIVLINGNPLTAWHQCN